MIFPNQYTNILLNAMNTPQIFLKLTFSEEPYNQNDPFYLPYFPRNQNDLCFHL